MFRLRERNTQFGVLDVASIKHVGQHIFDFVEVDLCAAITLGKFRFRIQESLDLNLRLETTRGETLQCFFDDTCERLAQHQHFAPSGGFLERVTIWGAKEPITVLEARQRAPLRPFGVAGPVVLRYCGHDDLDEAASRILAKFLIWAFNFRAAGSDLVAKRGVC
nr:hypothetical protein [Antarctobacter heliothermus]